MSEPASVNCAVDCLEGCVLGDRCPGRPFQEDAERFIRETPLDQMLEMAAEAVRRRQLERLSGNGGPQWVFPEDGIRPDDF
ncbi:hypothetical protein [Synechococcus elongatus]|uniref:Uncharacterized protein n=2 Tax=Synechococcus elongatus TaxID=32046 RepID=Q31LW1_SYNE7|nr:hypothetical protein [Synechococcus elongatus]ABB57958.1 conserved hypothetical protein [Synechococcus elongatus PCC 7942 = FACHB-805]AJD57562.1 hypothetical protein M744_06785 [Synechococcus elongatus UTEX 2973]MBD2586676.1 hypothetical protein [Synechococcus elongatus FACHB-242]MBD2687750.1 hypothetical protein [Synechococcus elongatus FACHB-1061]MBD2706540.1 hypothetical protein [Synechococcus elongatus PCC 7942 = FACHB-805]